MGCLLSAFIWTMSQKDFVVLRFGKILLQHFYMGQERFVVEILGTLGAFADTPLALDAGARHIRHVLRVDGTHGAQPGTGAAVGALGEVRLGLGLQEFSGLAVGTHRHIVGDVGIAGDFDWFRNSC